MRHRDAGYRAVRTIPSVGAFPLRPGSEAAQLDELKAFIESVLERVADAAMTYADDHGLS